MNVSAIPTCDYTWNPITGCRRGCKWCWARKVVKRFPKHYPNGFEPTFHPKRLSQPRRVRKPSLVFPCSMGDLLGDGVELQWLDRVVKAMHEAEQHIFQVLTKWPRRLRMASWPQGTWLGATVPDAMFLDEALIGLRQLGSHWYHTRYICFEPLAGPIGLPFGSLPFEWAIIGGWSGSRPTDPHVPEQQKWASYLMSSLRNRGIPVYVKPNLHMPWAERGNAFPGGSTELVPR